LAKRKPTKKEFETVISNILNEVDYIDKKLRALDSLFGLYLKWKKDVDKFNKFVEVKVQEADDKLAKNEPGEIK
jgi:hypothetical protein